MPNAKDLHRLTDADVIREVLPSNTLKGLARLMAWPLDSARAVIYRGTRVSKARRAALYQALLEFDEQQNARRAEIHRLLEARAHETRFEVAGDAELSAIRALALRIARDR